MARLEGDRAFVAILLAGVAFMVAGFVADVLVRPATETVAVPVTSGPATVLIPSILPLLAHADVAHGQSTVAAECGACHSFYAGAPAMVGPDLYGIVGARVAGSGGYAYSDALREVGGIWSYERLNRWLADPGAFAPGTLMSYGGMSGSQSRADVVAYLRTLADQPMPLPAATKP